MPASATVKVLVWQCDVRVHDLRHACATLLLTQGVHPKVVSEMLGHANISITLDTYSHVMPGLGEAPTSTVENLLDKDTDASCGVVRRTSSDL